MIRASFSAEDKILNVTLPKSWSELTQAELYEVYDIIAYSEGKPQGFIALHVFLALTRSRFESLSPDGKDFICSMPSKAGEKKKHILYHITPEALVEFLDELSWLSDPGRVPVRIESWKGFKAIDAQFHGLTFGEYIQVENLYQGFISAERNWEPLEMLVRILYPGLESVPFDGAFSYGVIQWLVQVKALFAANWPNFFRPATGSVSAPSMLEVMNNEIRALTGGDVTKEEKVFATECWRALTELDFKAKEAEDIKRQLAKTKQ